MLRSQTRQIPCLQTNPDRSVGSLQAYGSLRNAIGKTLEDSYYSFTRTLAGGVTQTRRQPNNMSSFSIPERGTDSVDVSKRRRRGDVVWPFRIQKVLGGGAMGDVYLAEHITDSFLVALKFIPEKLRENSVVAARFRRELRVLQKLRHPHIVKCLSNPDENDDSVPTYYAMEFVDGGTLEDLLRVRVRLSVEETFRYALQILGALSAAHRFGVVHRDVKPSNLLMARDRRALKLCDFGLAMVLGGTQLTQPGQTIGTPWYMSPEQIRGEDALNGTSDLYALGCILMEALTGKPPFVADTHFAILNRHLREDPPLVSSRQPNLPHGAFIDRFVTRLLDKDPNRRPDSAGDLIAEIAQEFPELKSGSGSGPSESRRTKGSDKGIPARERVQLARGRAVDVWQRLKSSRTIVLGLLLTLSVCANVLLMNQSSSVAMTGNERSYITSIPHQSAPARSAVTPLLAILARSDEHALGVLDQLLDAPEPEVRRSAVLAIGQLASGGSKFRARIQSLTRDESDMVRLAADATLRAMDQPAQ